MNISKYFLVQLTHVIMHFVTFLGFDERRFFFFIDYGCSFLSIIFSVHFMSLSTFAFPYFSHLSHCWFMIYFGVNQETSALGTCLKSLNYFLNDSASMDVSVQPLHKWWEGCWNFKLIKALLRTLKRRLSQLKF